MQGLSTRLVEHVWWHMDAGKWGRAGLGERGGDARGGADEELHGVPSGGARRARRASSVPVREELSRMATMEVVLLFALN